jgi:hypothetical protein
MRTPTVRTVGAPTKQWMKLAVELEHAESLRDNLRPVLKKR